MNTTLTRAEDRDERGADHWYRHFGLSFDPYEHLEASSDPHLADYTVNHEIFRAAWDDVPTILYAPPGGGKTATRVAVTRACWFDIGGSHPFPLPYQLGLLPWTGTPPTAAQHMRSLLEIGAGALFIGLAFRPERLFRASADTVHLTAGLLRATLPAPLEHYLAVLRETGNPAGLTPILERTYALSEPPDRAALEHFCDLLGAAPPAALSGGSHVMFGRFVDLLIHGLKFNKILVLVDGIDAIYENQVNPAASVRWVQWLLARSEAWRQANICLKLMAPVEIEAHLDQLLARRSLQMRSAHIVWTPALLLEMLQKRVAVASGGKFESLDAISSPDLTETEQRIIEAIDPLPRAALKVTQLALKHAAAQQHHRNGQMSYEDIKAAIEWYRKTASSTTIQHTA